MTGGEERAWHIDAPRVPTAWSKVPILVSIFRDSFRGCALAVFHSSRFYGEKKNHQRDRAHVLVSLPFVHMYENKWNLHLDRIDKEF